MNGFPFLSTSLPFTSDQPASANNFLAFWRALRFKPLPFDLGNSNVEFAIGNTILVHRKKQTNTLYTINALNELIKSLNNGVLDKSYSINWNDYKNCILLVQADGYKKIDTKIKEIINLS